jgi:hypothetical protein
VKRRHPETGDELSRKEAVTWALQSILRRSAFIVGFTVISFFWWVNPTFFHDPDLTHWNVIASWMAIVVEWIVGSTMLGQTLRDGQIIRRLERLEKTNIDIQSSDYQVDRETRHLVEAIARRMEIIP